jgi:predicted transcriptional regulator
MVDLSRTLDEVQGRAKVFYYLLGAKWSTAQEASEDLSMSRSQADRLLRNLYEVGVAERRKRETKSPGRPQYEYRIKPPFKPD